MEPKIFWSALSGKGQGAKTSFCNKTQILMGDWCSED